MGKKTCNPYVKIVKIYCTKGFSIFNIFVIDRMLFQKFVSLLSFVGGLGFNEMLRNSWELGRWRHFGQGTGLRHVRVTSFPYPCDVQGCVGIFWSMIRWLCSDDWKFCFIRHSVPVHVPNTSSQNVRTWKSYLSGQLYR